LRGISQEKSSPTSCSAYSAAESVPSLWSGNAPAELPAGALPFVALKTMIFQPASVRHPGGSRGPVPAFLVIPVKTGIQCLPRTEPVPVKTGNPVSRLLIFLDSAPGSGSRTGSSRNDGKETASCLPRFRVRHPGLDPGSSVCLSCHTAENRYPVPYLLGIPAPDRGPGQAPAGMTEKRLPPVSCLPRETGVYLVECSASCPGTGFNWDPSGVFHWGLLISDV